MRLIDADKIDFNEVFKGASDFAKDTREAAHGLIDEQPTIEAVPVVHGEWIPCENGGYYCSNCDRRVAFLVHQYFCPNCGAKMDRGGL